MCTCKITWFNEISKEFLYWVANVDMLVIL